MNVMRALWFLMVALLTGFAVQAQQRVNNFTVLTNLTVGQTLNGYAIDALLTNNAADKLPITNGTAVSLTGTSLSLSAALTSSATNYWAFGDSQTGGANGVSTNYTSGGALLPEYRWVNLIAGSLSLNLTNLGRGGSSHGYYLGSDQIGRQTPINRFGVNVDADWTGLVTLMIGYNHIQYIDHTPGFDERFENAQTAFIARALLDGWAGVGTAGTDNDGNVPATWATDGSETSSGYTDDAIFPTGAPGTDERVRLTLDNTDRMALTLTNKLAAGIFFDTSASGGTAYAYTNGTFAGIISTLYDGRSGFGQVQFPGVLWLEDLPTTCEITVTNVSGSNLMLGIGWVDAVSTSRKIVLGSIVKSVAYGPPYGAEIRMGAATQRAVARFSRTHPVYFADVFSRMVPEQDQQVGDEAHLTPWGNIHVAEAFLTPVSPLPWTDFAQAQSIQGTRYAAKAIGTNLVGIRAVDAPQFVVGPNASQTAHMRLGVMSTNTLRAELGFYQDGRSDSANLNWAWSQNSGASPSMRLIKYSGGVASGVGVAYDYTTLGATFPQSVDITGALTAAGSVTLASATPQLTLNPTAPGAVSRVLFQSNSITAFRLESSDNQTLRIVGTDTSGNAATVPIRFHRPGQVSHPLAVTNESTTALIGDVFVGNAGAGTDAEMYLIAPAGSAHRIGFRTGDPSAGTTTNRVFLEMTDANTFRINGRDTSGASAWNPFRLHLSTRFVTQDGYAWTNTATDSTFTGTLKTKQGIQLDRDDGFTGELLLSATNVTHWRIKESTNTLQVTRFTDAGVADGVPLEIDRSTGLTTLTSLSVSGVAQVFPTTATLTFSDTNVTQTATSRAYYLSTLTLTNNCLLTVTSTDGASGGITIVPDSSTSYTVYLDSGIKLLGGGSSFVVTNSASETVNLEWKQTKRGGSSVIIANKAVYP